MTISSREKEVPTRFLAARLYLDDIEEIREIILGAAASRVLRPQGDPGQVEVETKFYIGDQVCTEIQDLPKIKKRTRDFEMELSAPDGFSARFSVSSYATQWTSVGLTKADAWRAFHRLEIVFARRKIRLRNLLPNDQSNALFLLVGLFFPAFFFFALWVGRLIDRIRPSSTELGWLLFGAVSAAVLFPLGSALLRHSEVILRYSWEHAAQREERNAKIVIAAVSALIAFVLGVASLALKHKYWP